MRIARTLGIAVAALIVALLVTLAMPVRVWRTGELPSTPLVFLPDGAGSAVPPRVWIDTDAACGEGRRTDPDDCFAILALGRAPGVAVAGISTVFGNAPLEVTDRVTRQLVARLRGGRPDAPEVFRGSAGPLGASDPAPAPAHTAIRAALADGPLTVVALGPLTNIAAALRGRPDLRARVARLVAVMGRRPGHLFHPAEGAGGGVLLGHGPVFRDFNFVMDPGAVETVLDMGLSTTLVPYEAGREVEITGADIDRLRALGGAPAWVADRARGWLDYWRQDIGREGFYPFDLLAAGYVVATGPFRCAGVLAWVGEDRRMLVPFLRPTALLVAQDRAAPADARSSGDALYCAKVEADLAGSPMAWLGVRRDGEPSVPVSSGAGGSR